LLACIITTRARDETISWNDSTNGPLQAERVGVAGDSREQAAIGSHAPGPVDRCSIMTCIFPENHDQSLGASLQPGRGGPSDRRQVPTGPMDAFRLSGRRQRVRRGAEREGPFFTDRFDALTLAFIVAVLVLCIVDGVLTIELLDVNNEEANPVMRFLLDRGHLPFLVGKYAITAAGLPFLVVYKNWPFFGTRFRAGFLLPVFLGLYLGLIAYQVHLLGST
jgi:Domain of unknown function (DUF5658)